MSPAELQSYLHEHIPLSKAMAVGVMSLDTHSATLRAPLGPNINHRDTVFGGSASALAILAAWSLLHVRLRSQGVSSRLVIQRNTIDYDHPILGDFTARASLEQSERWAPFISTLVRRGKARIAVVSLLEYGGQTVGRFAGQFVALT
jgi:thioesterase domain-containing protein